MTVVSTMPLVSLVPIGVSVSHFGDQCLQCLWCPRCLLVLLFGTLATAMSGVLGAHWCFCIMLW